MPAVSSWQLPLPQGQGGAVQHQTHEANQDCLQDSELQPLELEPGNLAGLLPGQGKLDQSQALKQSMQPQWMTAVRWTALKACWQSPSSASLGRLERVLLCVKHIGVCQAAHVRVSGRLMII